MQIRLFGVVVFIQTFGTGRFTCNSVVIMDVHLYFGGEYVKLTSCCNFYGLCQAFW